MKTADEDKMLNVNLLIVNLRLCRFCQELGSCHLEHDR